MPFACKPRCAIMLCSLVTRRICLSSRLPFSRIGHTFKMSEQGCARIENEYYYWYIRITTCCVLSHSHSCRYKTVTEYKLFEAPAQLWSQHKLITIPPKLPTLGPLPLKSVQGRRRHFTFLTALFRANSSVLCFAQNFVKHHHMDPIQVTSV